MSSARSSTLWASGSRIARNTLAQANEKRDWRIYADFAMVLIQQARKLYAEDPFGVNLKNTAYALDATTRAGPSSSPAPCAKKNFAFERRSSRPVNKKTGVQFDQTVVLTGFYSDLDYPEPLRRIGFIDVKTGKRLRFLVGSRTGAVALQPRFQSPPHQSQHADFPHCAFL